MSTKKLNTEGVRYDDIMLDLDLSVDACGYEYHIDEIVDRFLLEEFTGETDLYSAIMTSVFGTLDELNRADTMEMVEAVAKDHREDLQYYTDLRMSVTGGFNQNPLEAVVCGAQDVIHDILQAEAKDLAVASMAYHLFEAFKCDVGEPIPSSAWELAQRIVSTYDLENVKANQIISDAHTIASLGDAKEQKPRCEMYDELTKLQSVIYPPNVDDDDPEYDEWEGGTIEFRFVTKSGKVTASAKIWTHAAYVQCIDGLIDEFKELIIEEEGDEFDYT